jgi:hypothetical protein
MEEEVKEATRPCHFTYRVARQPALFKADSHTACRAHAVPLPGRAAPMLFPRQAVPLRVEKVFPT